MQAMIRKSRKTTDKAPAPQILEGALKNLGAMSENIHEQEKHSPVSTQTMVSAITNAAVSIKYAMQLELATGLVLFAEHDGVNRDSKQALQKIYCQAGYDAEDQYKPEYKTVRRRIDAAGELFDWIGHDKIAQLIEHRAEMAAITALVQHLEQYNLRGINSVLALVGKPVKPGRKPPMEVAADKQPSEAKKPEPAPETPKEEAPRAPTEAERSVAEALGAQIDRSRAERQDKPGTLRFNTENVQVIVAPDATRAELIQITMELLQFAETLVIAEPAEKFKQAA